MRPKWRDLLFLHWDFAPHEIQNRLPEGLEVETFENRAYLGLVPFEMRDVRPFWAPNLGRLGAWYDQFPELNVRTYVRRAMPDGSWRSGVWFFSLDAQSLAAVCAARAWFGLPYFKARMRFRRRENRFDFFSNRLWPAPKNAICRAKWRSETAVFRAQPGSLEAFLVERYTLFSWRNDQFFAGEVAHEPYVLQNAKIEFLQESCLRAAGFSRPEKPPHVLFSRGVDVEVFGLERV